MEKSKGYEISSVNPGWIKRKIPESFNTDELKRIVLFFVINTPCTDLSSRALSVQSYGWKKDVWKKGKLREKILSVADLKSKQNFFTAKKNR